MAKTSPIPLTLLKAEVVTHRRATCRACPHAIPFPWPQHERFVHCGLLHDPKKPIRHRSHYLRVLTALPDVACPDGRWARATEADLRGPSDPPPKSETVYEVLWREIHDPKRRWDKRFVDSVYLRLPCGDCKQHFAQYMRAHPVPFGDDEACWEWGWRLHQEINVRLKKPGLTLEGARERWGVGLSTSAPVATMPLEKEIPRCAF